MHDDRPQRYGTQFLSCGDGPARLWPVTDVAGANARRASLDLPPIPAEDLADVWTAAELAAHRRNLAAESS